MTTEKNGNQIAGEGEVFVCEICGRRSKDRYGYQHIDEGWDESCRRYAVLCYYPQGPGGWRAVE